MVKGKRKSAPTYRIWLEAEVHESRIQLPGKVRQRVKRLFSDLGYQPRPSPSQTLDTAGIDLPSDVEIRRIRLEEWRIIYAVNDHEKWAWVLAIRQRPPYDYEDLPVLISKLSS